MGFVIIGVILLCTYVISEKMHDDHTIILKALQHIREHLGIEEEEE